MSGLTRLFKTALRISAAARPQQQLLLVQPTAATAAVGSVRTIYRHVEKPKPGTGQAFRRIVHYPDEYTVRPLEVTNLAGRDPVSGRMVAKGIGGGIKHKYHWIKWVRDGPADGPPQVEKVIEVLIDGCRTANVALVAVGDELKYILATENMKAGDLIRTSRHIPRIPGGWTTVGLRQEYVIIVLYFFRAQFVQTKATPIRWALCPSAPRSTVWKRIPASRAT